MQGDRHDLAPWSTLGDWVTPALVCAGVIIFELSYDAADISWARLSGFGWAFVACTLGLLLVGTWRLRRGDATASPAVEPRALPAPRQALLAALGVATFACLYSYLFSLPHWLTRATQWVLATLGVDNRGSFQFEMDGIRFAGGLAAQVLIIGALLLLNRWLPGLAHTRPDATDREPPYLNRRGLLRIAGLFAALIAMQILGVVGWSTFAGLAESQGQPMPRDLQPLVSQIADWHGPSWILSVIFLSVTLGAPLMEEIGFRAILYPALRETLPRGWAVALTGLIFGILHGNLAALIPISLMGAWLCLVRDRFGIGTCILVHALNNAWTILWLVLAPEVAGRM